VIFCRKVTCLENLTSSEITMLSHSMGIRRYRPGEPIYRAGDPGDCLYVVHRGTVVETAHDRKGDQIILVKGSTFGEDALMGNEPRVSTMVAGPNEPPSTTGMYLTIYFSSHLGGLGSSIMIPSLTKQRPSKEHIGGGEKSIYTVMCDANHHLEM
jgi:hypothetical protein